MVRRVYFLSAGAVLIALVMASTTELGFWADATASWADETKPPAAPAGHTEAADEEDADFQWVQPATTIHFPTELGVAFPSLIDLGARIEGARQAFDPVGLAVCAQLLQAAEKAGGKQASLTSAALRKEAVTMAKDRNGSVELTAVASLVGEAGAELQQLAEKARVLEEEAEAAAERGEVPRSHGHVVDTLHILNRSHFEHFTLHYRCPHGHWRTCHVRPHGHHHLYNVRGPFLRARGCAGTQRIYYIPTPRHHHTIRLGTHDDCPWN